MNSILNSTKSMITVLCLEGCHGSGKTELCKYFAKNGFKVLDEAFLDMPTFSIPNQSLTMETVWVSNWFQRLLKMEKIESQNPNRQPSIYIADRSPYSAILYSKNKGHYLDPIISEQIVELKKYTDIDIKTVYLRVDKDLLWKRIQNRLLKEPERMKYNEDSYEWMEETVNFYEGRQWDFVVDNSLSQEKVLHQITQPLNIDIDTIKQQASNISFVPSC